MKRKIYHVSSEIIDKPEFGYGKPYTDHGLGKGKGCWWHGAKGWHERWDGDGEIVTL